MTLVNFKGYLSCGNFGRDKNYSMYLYFRGNQLQGSKIMHALLFLLLYLIFKDSSEVVCGLR